MDSSYMCLHSAELGLDSLSKTINTFWRDFEDVSQEKSQTQIDRHTHRENDRDDHRQTSQVLLLLNYLFFALLRKAHPLHYRATLQVSYLAVQSFPLYKCTTLVFRYRIRFATCRPARTCTSTNPVRIEPMEINVNNCYLTCSMKLDHNWYDEIKKWKKWKKSGNFKEENAVRDCERQLFLKSFAMLEEKVL